MTPGEEAKEIETKKNSLTSKAREFFKD